ncbi:HTH-type transcriptional regulator BhcR [Roseivivax isoporae]|uniref:IclR family transcriptional regulator n=1 Tax=Roseivivax isoporae LMG 25204 TaxID=1449351 RepID=X7F8U3_9RHOB|nr:HTH-type transcriptional regulator BhcR [Roseivivax isoporae]ETX29327.1 IclR family transcriptional regulator [Roseivivax isoporae LMG 25204]
MATGDDTPESGRRARGRPRGWHDRTEQNTIKSLDRAMEVLDRLSELPGVSLSALAADLDQSPATVYRVLTTLEGRGLVEFDAEAQLWHVGAQAFVIGARFLRRTSLVERARPILRNLMEATGETANLGVARGPAVLFVSQVETDASIRAFFPPGTLSPMHASGIGKALLARMDERRLARLLSTPLERFTEHTFCDADALRTELAATRARGWALDGEEKTLGMRCIAAPVFDMSGEAVAGVSVSGPVSRVSDGSIDRVAQEVCAAAAALTAAVGGVWPAPAGAGGRG